MKYYRVGDKVRIVNHRNAWWNWRGEMDKWMGKVMTVRTANGDHYEMEEDKHENGGIGWGWESDDFAELISNPVNKDKIVIMHDGKTTTATLYRENGTKEKATAKCSPEDTFDFNVGAKLAMERLMEKVTTPSVKELNVKFKTGDYAKIIANKHYHGFEIGTIVKLKKETHDYLATADGESWWVLDDELEAYTPPKYYNGKVVCVMSKYNDEFTAGKIYTFVDGTVRDNFGNVRYKICPVEDPSQIGIIWEFIPYVE